MKADEKSVISRGGGKEGGRDIGAAGRILNAARSNDTVQYRAPFIHRTNTSNAIQTRHLRLSSLATPPAASARIPKSATGEGGVTLRPAPMTSFLVHVPRRKKKKREEKRRE